MISATFDLTLGWSFDGEPSTEFSILFTDANRVGDERRYDRRRRRPSTRVSSRVYPNNIAFGWTVLVNGQSTDSVSWPPEHIVIRELSVEHLFYYRIEAAPDDELTLTVWATNLGTTVEDNTTFVVPRPPSPFPSWTWVDGRWTPPVPYPDDGGDYVWDEESQSWATVDPISEQGDD